MRVLRKPSYEIRLWSRRLLLFEVPPQVVLVGVPLAIVPRENRGGLP